MLAGTGAMVGAGIHMARSHPSPAPDETQIDGPVRGRADIDWQRLIALNPDTVGWLAVGGTPIEYPIVRPHSADEEDFYLTHGIDREPSLEGTPYLDIRSEVNGQHLLLFGHHVILDRTAQFSPIYQAFNQEVLDGISQARWLSPQTAPEVFHPLMALKVPETFAPIQRFRFEGDEDLRSWLRDLLDQAGSCVQNGDGLAARATRALTLCTCSAERAGGSDRTLMLFVR